MPFSSQTTDVETLTVSCAGAGTQVIVNKENPTEMQLRSAMTVAETCSRTDLDCGRHCTLNQYLLANREKIESLLKSKWLKKYKTVYIKIFR